MLRNKKMLKYFLILSTKLIGAGVAAVSMAGFGAGIGSVFSVSGLMGAVSRNSSLKKNTIKISFFLLIFFSFMHLMNYEAYKKAFRIRFSDEQKIIIKKIHTKHPLKYYFLKIFFLFLFLLGYTYWVAYTYDLAIFIWHVSELDYIKITYDSIILEDSYNPNRNRRRSLKSIGVGIGEITSFFFVITVYHSLIIRYRSLCTFLILVSAHISGIILILKFLNFLLVFLHKFG